MALIVVLGFVAVLAVLAISLIITMRVERLATNSFAETVRARQLIHVALARAMNELDTDMTNRFVVYPQDIYRLNSGSGVILSPFPDWQSRLYVPRGLTGALPSAVNLTNVNVGGTVVGRVGFVAVDMSGQVDANVAGKLSRGRGINGSEVQITSLLNTDVVSAATFLARRSNEWRRFETIAEMMFLVLNTNRSIENFATYSRFGPDLNPLGQEKILLSGDVPTLLLRRDAITNALHLCGIPDTAMVFTNLLDYVDTDSIPRDLESFTTEAVPMINEVVFSNVVARQVSGSDTVTIHRLYMTVESWFPFPDRSFPASTLEVVGSPIINVLATVPAELAIDPSVDLRTPAPGTIGAFTPNSFQLTTFMWEKRVTNAPIAQPAAVVRVQMNSSLAVEQGGNRLDLARFPNNNLDVRAPIPPSPGVTRISSLSVIDPRLNHLPQTTNWMTQVAQGSPPPNGIVTPGSINQNAVGVGEGVSRMYVRDFPLDLPKAGVGVGSVGELGYLSIGSPWRTIALYNTPNGGRVHPVLDYFTLEAPDVRRGLININSPNTNALASAFVSMPVEAYPGEGGPTVTVQAARTLARNLMDRLGTTNRYERNRTISVIGEFDQGLIATLNGELSSPVLTDDAARESLIRNASGLFSYRQNLFNVYLYAQSITPGGATGAEARAVATIWRDPEFSDPSNRTNKMLLRFFRWL